MSHNTKITDMDPLFVIDPITRAITKESGSKTTVIQYDHNSEKFTFSLPKIVEGHDMTECNRVEVHYVTVNGNTGIYEVTDLSVYPEDDSKVVCTWLLSQNATADTGVLSFLVRFSCVAEDGTIEYAWNTSIYAGISVQRGLYNAEAIVEENADILEAWYARLFSLSDEGVSNVNTARAKALSDITTAKNQALDEIDTARESIPDDYSDLSDKINGVITSQFVPLTKDSAEVVYQNQYADSTGELMTNTQYISYAITANDSFSCWFGECASAYTSLAIYTGEVSEETFIARYRRNGTQDTLPTETNPLTVASGSSIVVTVYTGYNFELYNNSDFFSVKSLNNDISLNDNHIKRVKTELIKESKVRYEQKGDNHTEELAIYIPCTVGYLQYNFAHVVDDTDNADNWHLWKVYAVDDSLFNRYRVVTAGEWEMALRLKNRNDFSGGYMHGDEIGTELTVLVDGKIVSPTSLTELTTFKSLRLITKSNVYDPIDGTTLIAVHGCERIFENGELTIKQNVVWQIDGQMDQNYLAMFPIGKTDGNIQIINKMYTDMDYTQIDLTQVSSTLNINKVKKVTAYGENTGVVTSVEVLEYPEGLTGGDKFRLSDNGGQNYYKMYFVVADSGNVASGDVWRSKVIYKIDISK